MHRIRITLTSRNVKNLEKVSHARAHPPWDGLHACRPPSQCTARRHSTSSAQAERLTAVHACVPPYFITCTQAGRRACLRASLLHNMHTGRQACMPACLHAHVCALPLQLGGRGNAACRNNAQSVGDLRWYYARKTPSPFSAQTNTHQRGRAGLLSAAAMGLRPSEYCGVGVRRPYQGRQGQAAQGEGPCPPPHEGTCATQSMCSSDSSQWVGRR